MDEPPTIRGRIDPDLGRGRSDRPGRRRRASRARPSRQDWVGIVANRNSGTGPRPCGWSSSWSSELATTGASGTEVAWTPEERRPWSARPARDARAGAWSPLAAMARSRPCSTNGRTVPAHRSSRPGTENLVARHFGLGRDPARPGRDDRRRPAGPRRRRPGRGRRFLLMAGFGFDGDVVTRHHRARVSHSGSSGPPIGSPTSSRSCGRVSPTGSRRSRCGSTTRAPRKSCAGTTVFVFNLPRYALGLPFVPVGTRRRRLARPGRLPQPGTVSGFVLPVEGLLRHPSRRSRRVPSPGQGRWS